MKELVNRIIAEMDAFRTDSEKFLNGNKAAGARARKASVNIAKMTAQFRKESVNA